MKASPEGIAFLAAVKAADKAIRVAAGEHKNEAMVRVLEAAPHTQAPAPPTLAAPAGGGTPVTSLGANPLSVRLLSGDQENGGRESSVSQIDTEAAPEPAAEPSDHRFPPQSTVRWRSA